MNFLLSTYNYIDYPLRNVIQDFTMQYTIGKNDVLIIVDVQNDFCPEGALPVPRGDKIIPILNQYIELFERMGAKIYATRDWHPPNHVSFVSQGGKWPAHCVRGTRGAEFHPDLNLTEKTKIISKATHPKKEAYSGFDGTILSEELEKNESKRIFIGGLATDYCVKNTVLDSLKLGYQTYLLADATLGVNLNSDDTQQAIEEMVKKGAKKSTLTNFFSNNLS